MTHQKNKKIWLNALYNVFGGMIRNTCKMIFGFVLVAMILGLLAVVPYYLSYGTCLGINYLFYPDTSCAGPTVAIWLIGVIEAMIVGLLLLACWIVGNNYYHKVTGWLSNVLDEATYRRKKK